MSVLTVTDVPDEIVAELQRRAATHGQSVEDEHRRILEESLTEKGKGLSFKEHLLAMPDVGEDWMFDRNDPRMKLPEKPPMRFDD